MAENLTPLQQEMAALGAKTRPADDPGTVPTIGSQTQETFLDKFGPVREGQFTTMTTIEGRPETRYPALEPDPEKRLATAVREYTPINIPLTSLRFPGAGAMTEYAPKINWKAARPDVSLSEILPLDDDDYRENRFMKFDAMENADGRRYRIADLPFDRKLSLADSFGATKFIRYDDTAENGERVIDIPWEEKILDLTQLPEGYSAILGGKKITPGNMTFEQFKRHMIATRLGSTFLTMNEEATRALQAIYLNEVLMETGMDSRSRYLIINENIKDIGFDEAVRFTSGVGENIVKGFGELALYGIGETYGLAAAVLQANTDGTIADYEGRETVMDNWWRPLSFEVVDYFANQNVVVPLGVAQDLASVQTGNIPQLAQLYVEIIGPSKATLKLMGIRAESELEKFELFAQDKLRANKDLDQQQLIGMFIDKRAEDPTFSFSTPSGVDFNIRVPGLGMRRKSRAAAVEERLVNAFQILDSKLPVEERANVVSATKYLAGLRVRRDATFAKAQETGAIEDYNTMRQLDQQIIDAEVDLANVKMRSSTPKFIQDLQTVDRFVFGGAAAGGLFFEHVLDKDSELGQIIGLGIGFTYGMSKGRFSPAVQMIRARLSRKNNQRGKLQFVVNEIAKQNPLIRDQVMDHGLKLLGYQDELIAAGVDPAKLNATLPVMTDIGTLRLFEDSILRDVQVKGIFDPDNVLRIQESLTLQKRLNTELSTILEDMRGTTEADQQFFNFIDAVLTENKKNVEFLQTQLQSVEKGAVGHYLNSLNSNIAALDAGSPLNAQSAGQVPTFSEAIDNLHAVHLVDMSALPANNLKAEVNRTSKVVNRAITLKANELLTDIGNEKDARKDFRKRNSKNVAANTTPQGLFMMHLEDQYTAAHTIAVKPFKYLESEDVKFYADGQLVRNADMTVDASDVFVSFFTIPVRGDEGMVPLRRRLDEALSPAETKAITDQMEIMVEPFFMQQAASEGVTYEKWLGKQVTRYKSQGKSFNTKQYPNRTARVAQLMLEEIEEQSNGATTIPFFEITPMQLRTLGRTVTSMKFENKDKGAKFESLQEIESLVNQKFSEFTVGDRPIEQVGVLDPETNQVVALNEYISNMNAGYSQFMKTWHDTDVDNSFIAVRMAHGSQKKMLLSGDHPTGKSYGDRPINEMLTIDDLTDPARANRFMLSMGQAMGESVGTKGFRLIEGAENTKVMESYLRAVVGEAFAEAAASGKMTPADIGLAARAIENNITMVTSTGREVPLFSVAKVIDDTIGNLETSVPRQMLEKADADVANKIEKAVEAAVEPARQRKAELEEATEILSRATSTNLSSDKIGSFIIEGGRNRYNKFVAAMRGAGKTNEEINRVLRDSYLLNIEREMFTETGRELVHRKFDPETQANKITKELEANPAVLNRALGRTPEERELIKEILGEETYNVWSAASKFLAELENNPLAQTKLALKGVPRSLSVESYISRFYAINRGVVRPQYVGTEATLQQLRANNFNFFVAVLTDPDLGQLFLETLRTGKPLTDEKQVKFSNLLIQAYAQSSFVHEAETREVVDAAGRKFTLNATFEEKVETGYVTPEFLRGYSEQTGQEFLGPLYTPSQDYLQNNLQK